MITDLGGSDKIMMLIVNILFHQLSKKTNEKIILDIQRKDMQEPFSIRKLYNHLVKVQAYRNIFYFRVTRDLEYEKSLWMKILLKIFTKKYPLIQSIELGILTELGGGFYLPHRYCVVSAKSIGDNVTIMQGVTIGKDQKGKKPSIGNNVKIFPNAVVVGG